MSNIVAIPRTMLLHGIPANDETSLCKRQRMDNTCVRVAGAGGNGGITALYNQIQQSGILNRGEKHFASLDWYHERTGVAQRSRWRRGGFCGGGGGGGGE